MGKNLNGSHLRAAVKGTLQREISQVFVCVSERDRQTDRQTQIETETPMGIKSLKSKCLIPLNLEPWTFVICQCSLGSFALMRANKRPVGSSSWWRIKSGRSFGKVFFLKAGKYLKQ